MEDPRATDGRLANMTRRWRKRLAQSIDPDSQMTFFPEQPVPTASSSVAPASATARTVSPEQELPHDPELTVDQAEALRDIDAAFEPGGFYLLTGYAGAGKTYLMQRLTKNMLAKQRSEILSAPTHKAVAVLKRKLDEAKIEGVTCRSIQSVLSLSRSLGRID